MGRTIVGISKDVAKNLPVTDIWYAENPEAMNALCELSYKIGRGGGFVVGVVTGVVVLTGTLAVINLSKKKRT